MLDILLLILLSVGFVGGLFSGAVKQVVSLTAFVLGFVVACLYYQRLGDWLTGVLSSATLSQAVAFVLLWAVVPIVANLVSGLVTKALNLVPVLGLLNRLLGGLLGMVKYGLVLGALIMLFSSVGFLKEETMQASRLARPLMAVPEYIYNTLSRGTRDACQETAMWRAGKPTVANWPTSRA